MATTLADQFIIRLKPDYKFETNLDDVIKLIPPKYRKMFSVIWNEFQNFEEIMSASNLQKIICLVKDIETEEEKFTYKYRIVCECLQSIIRDTFFDIILIIRNKPQVLTTYITLSDTDKLQIQVIEKNDNPSTYQTYNVCDIRTRESFDLENKEESIEIEFGKYDEYLKERINLKW